MQSNQLITHSPGWYKFSLLAILNLQLRFFLYVIGNSTPPDVKCNWNHLSVGVLMLINNLCKKDCEKNLDLDAKVRFAQTYREKIKNLFWERKYFFILNFVVTRLFTSWNKVSTFTNILYNNVRDTLKNNYCSATVNRGGYHNVLKLFKIFISIKWWILLYNPTQGW